MSGWNLRVTAMIAGLCAVLPPFISQSAVAQSADAQTGGLASVSGSVTDPDGIALKNVPVQVRNSQTGALRSTNTSTAGVYRFDGLRPGTYNLSVPSVGFTLDRFEQKDLLLH